MTELFSDTVLNMMTTTAEPEDYTGEDGLLYCGKCRTAILELIAELMYNEI